MISVNCTDHQLYNGKHTQFLLMNFNIPTGILAGQISDHYHLNFPAIKQSVTQYVSKITQLVVFTESTDYNIGIVDDPSDITTGRWLVYIKNINNLYNDTKLDVFLDNLNQGEPKLVLRIENNSLTTISNIKFRVIVEVFQQPIDGIGQMF